MNSLRTERLLARGAMPGASDTRDPVAHAAAILRSGGLVAFPTETVYGLGANALDESAVAKIFEAKGRPSWDPLIVHVCDQEMLARVIAPLTGETATRVEKLTQAFWPGPLTLLLPKHPDVPMAVTAGRSRIGVRMPQHPVALDLIRQAGVPIAAPSANRFGHTSPTTAQHVLQDLDGRIDAVLDAGPTLIGVESTVLDVCPEGSEGMLVYRPGKVTLAEIETVAGTVRLYVPPVSEQDPDSGLPSPGFGLRHYAPCARLILVDGEQQLKQMFHKMTEEEVTVGLMLPNDWNSHPYSDADQIPGRIIVFPWAEMDDDEAQARLLFAGLRHLDDLGATVILCPLPAAKGLGEAMLDRLRKASLR